jgi:transcriptional regulator with XRE-family HTH domain
MTDREILAEIGRRLRRYRLAQDIPLLDVAERAGLSKTTVANAEAGRNPTLETVVRILRVLNRLDGLEAFLPTPRVSPIELLERGSKTPRQRASGRTHTGD